MSLRTDELNNGMVIHLQEKFDFSGAEKFRAAYEGRDVEEYTINFEKTDYMDSSGLGMLLNMKRNIGNKPVNLINCKPQIKKVLVISRFDEQFHIS